MPLVAASVLLPIVFHQHTSAMRSTASHGLTTAAAAAAEPPTLSSTASRDARALRPPGDGDDDSDDDTACAALERDARADDDRAAEPPRKPKEWETRSPHFSAVLVPGSLAGRREAARAALAAVHALLELGHFVDWLVDDDASAPGDDDPRRQRCLPPAAAAVARRARRSSARDRAHAWRRRRHGARRAHRQGARRRRLLTRRPAAAGRRRGARYRVVHTRLERGGGGGRSPWSAVARALGEWAWKTAPLARLQALGWPSRKASAYSKERYASMRPQDGGHERTYLVFLAVGRALAPRHTPAGLLSVYHVEALAPSADADGAALRGVARALRAAAAAGPAPRPSARELGAARALERLTAYDVFWLPSERARAGARRAAPSARSPDARAALAAERAEVRRARADVGASDRGRALGPSTAAFAALRAAWRNQSRSRCPTPTSPCACGARSRPTPPPRRTPSGRRAWRSNSGRAPSVPLGAVPGALQARGRARCRGRHGRRIGHARRRRRRGRAVRRNGL